MSDDQAALHRLLTDCRDRLTISILEHESPGPRVPPYPDVAGRRLRDRVDAFRATLLVSTGGYTGQGSE